MAVAVELLPVTGQTLPMVSSGGTSIWMTCVSIGLILSVTRKEEEVAKDEDEKRKRDEALQRIIDKEVALEGQVKEEDENEEEGRNPLEPILNQ